MSAACLSPPGRSAPAGDGSPERDAEVSHDAGLDGSVPGSCTAFVPASVVVVAAAAGNLDQRGDDDVVIAFKPAGSGAYQVAVFDGGALTPSFCLDLPPTVAPVAVAVAPAGVAPDQRALAVLSTDGQVLRYPVLGLDSVGEPITDQVTAGAATPTALALLPLGADQRLFVSDDGGHVQYSDTYAPDGHVQSWATVAGGTHSGGARIGAMPGQRAYVVAASPQLVEWYGATGANGEVALASPVQGETFADIKGDACLDVLGWQPGTQQMVWVQPPCTTGTTASVPYADTVEAMATLPPLAGTDPDVVALIRGQTSLLSIRGLIDITAQTANGDPFTWSDSGDCALDSSITPFVLTGAFGGSVNVFLMGPDGQARRLAVSKVGVSC